MAKNLIKRDFVHIPLDQLELNEGQLEGLPSNPRDIDEGKFELLKKNIEEHPDLLELNMLLVYPLENGHYIIIGGNMRYRALSDLGRTEAPCAIIPKETSIDELKAYAIITNNSFGKWNWDILANEWYDMNLEELGTNTSFFHKSDDINLEGFFDNQSAVAASGEKGEKLTVTIPDDFKEQKEEIKERIEMAICADFQGIKVR